jgi:antitoxin component of MazEF toxin-antitoxin module
MELTLKVIKLGKSKGLIIPAKALKNEGISEGTTVVVTIQKKE